MLAKLPGEIIEQATGLTFGISVLVISINHPAEAGSALVSPQNFFSRNPRPAVPSLAELTPKLFSSNRMEANVPVPGHCKQTQLETNPTEDSCLQVLIPQKTLTTRT